MVGVGESVDIGVNVEEIDVSITPIADGGDDEDDIGLLRILILSETRSTVESLTSIARSLKSKSMTVCSALVTVCTLAIIVFASCAQARFGRENPRFFNTVERIGCGQGLFRFAGRDIRTLLAAADPCDKIDLADGVLSYAKTEFGCPGTDNYTEVLYATMDFVAAEKNYNPFTINKDSICDKPWLPQNPELQGILQYVDPRNLTIGGIVPLGPNDTALATAFNIKVSQVLEQAKKDLTGPGNKQKSLAELSVNKVQLREKLKGFSCLEHRFDGQEVATLLGHANPCDKLKMADYLVQWARYGCNETAAYTTALLAAMDLVAAEKNFDQFSGNKDSICIDYKLPIFPELRGILQYVDPREFSRSPALFPRGPNDTAVAAAFNTKVAGILEQAKKDLKGPGSRESKSLAELSVANGFPRELIENL
ncbi:hypothetical protein HDU97_008550 [Phlyctochytrium planicorne]|nr:hypothetical protein HDU97_008550 [Phlyctochytrium planicorne]